MKLTKILPLSAALLLMACSSTPAAASSAPAPAASSNPPEVSSAETSQKATSKMTSIGLGKLYIDINLSTMPDDFKIKVGDQEITSSTTITMSSTMEFTVEGSLNNVCFYRAVETAEPIVWSAGKSENVDEEVASNMLARYLTKIAAKLSTARAYFCITDTVGGWSKTVAGVDWVITTYAPSF